MKLSNLNFAEKIRIIFESFVEIFARTEKICRIISDLRESLFNLVDKTLEEFLGRAINPSYLVADRLLEFNLIPSGICTFRGNLVTGLFLRRLREVFDYIDEIDENLV